MPLNLLLDPNGNIVVTEQLDGTEVAQVVKPGAGNRVSHFATCPAADDWRQQRHAA